jgi:hypothetical protein
MTWRRYSRLRARLLNAINRHDEAYYEALAVMAARCDSIERRFNRE